MRTLVKHARSFSVVLVVSAITLGPLAAGCGGSPARGDEANSAATNTQAASATPGGEQAAGATSAGSATSSAGTAASETSSGSSSAQPASQAPAIADAAMHIQSTTGATSWFSHVDIERRDDGSLYFNGQQIGRVNAGVVYTMDGQRVPVSGRLSLGTRRSGREHLEVQPDQSITMDMGRLTIDPSGEVMLTRGGNSRPVHIHVTGYRPETASLASLLLAYGMIKADIASR